MRLNAIAFFAIYSLKYMQIIAIASKAKQPDNEYFSLKKLFAISNISLGSILNFYSDNCNYRYISLIYIPFNWMLKK